MTQPTIKIATLNCRGLKKQGQPQKRKLFIRHLRSLGYDVLLLQETHVTTPQLQQELNLQFQTSSSHWTPHCGIVILNDRYSLDVVQDGIDGGRFILARIRLGTPTMDDTLSCPIIATVLNIYGRAQVHSQRSAFYAELLRIPTVMDTLTSTTGPPCSSWVISTIRMKITECPMAPCLALLPLGPPFWASILWIVSRTKNIQPGHRGPPLPLSISSSAMPPLTSMLLISNKAISTKAGQP